MAGLPFTEATGSTRASDFLNFEAPTYGQHGSNSMDASRSQGFTSSLGSGLGSSGMFWRVSCLTMCLGNGIGGTPASVTAPSAFGRTNVCGSFVTYNNCDRRTIIC